MGEKGNALPSETRMEESNAALGGGSTTRALDADPGGGATGGPGIADQAAGGGLSSYQRAPSAETGGPTGERRADPRNLGTATLGQGS